jgi:hypothetical protein
MNVLEQVTSLTPFCKQQQQPVTPSARSDQLIEKVSKNKGRLLFECFFVYGLLWTLKLDPDKSESHIDFVSIITFQRFVIS